MDHEMKDNQEEAVKSGYISKKGKPETGKEVLLPAKEKKEDVRHRMAGALEDCMREMPLERITVRQITLKCGVSRQTFYRNFQDKYALVNWYFDELLNKAFLHMGYGKTAYDSLVHKFTYIRD